MIINGVFEDTLTNVIRANHYTPGLLLYLMTYTRTRSLHIINCNALAIVTVNWKERGRKEDYSPIQTVKFNWRTWKNQAGSQIKFPNTKLYRKPLKLYLRFME